MIYGKEVATLHCIMVHSERKPLCTQLGLYSGVGDLDGMEDIF